MINKTNKNIVYHLKFIRTESSRKLLYEDCTFTYRKILQ